MKLTYIRKSDSVEVFLEKYLKDSDYNGIFYFLFIFFKNFSTILIKRFRVTLESLLFFNFGTIYILTAEIWEFVFHFSGKLHDGFLSNFAILFSLLLSGL